MAFAAGAVVANLYYNQPLLTEIGATFRASEELLGLVPTMPPVGYALGILFLLPIGDSHERRRWIVGLTGLVGLLLVGVGLSPSLPWFLVASTLMGAATVVPQMLVPFAATLAPPESRGRIIGSVMSGLLIGILLSRTVAGFVGEALGWRSVYLLAAGAMFLLAILLRAWLPEQRPEAPLPYAALLRSMLVIFREEPVVRRHAYLGAISFGAFAGFWATLALHLQDLSPAYGPRVAGMYGVVGVVGALAAPLVGRYADRRPNLGIHLFAITLLVASFSYLGFFGRSLLHIAIAVIFLDLAAQSNHIANQTRVYAQRPEARSRLNSLYMFGCFVGSSAGTYLASFAWAQWGWTGVCAVGAGIASLGWLVLALARRQSPLPPPERAADA